MKNKILLATLLTSFISFAASADSELSPWYVGAGLGINDYQNQCAKSVTTSCDDNTPYGWELFTGFMFNQYIGIELGYRDLSKANWTNFNGEVNDYGSIDTKGTTLGLVGYYPFAERWNLNAEVGAMRYTSKITNQWGDVFGDSETGHHTDYTPYIGAGVGFNVTDNVMLSVLYRHYQDLNPTQNNFYDLENNYWGIKLSYRFGSKAKSLPTSTAIVTKVDTIVADKVPLIDTPYRFDIDSKFDHDSTVINEAAYQDIKKVADFMKAYPNSKVTISGHASNIGSAKYNLSLSTRRAQAVEALLILKFNIDPSRITSKGYGFTQPLIKGHSAAANEVNRRIEAEITITSPTP
ncbi:OmpA family protein [Shewanella surugensis]|uniref:OmpA family protein n=1 Tax=Shewanella surugensis TaxID=212020 RepID=A0ABT0L5Q2_9GAMM|nr:OmpA family protein [Shewanella surugensis]MCL1123004.1 OmpA family protein [Shewanella surugensis]